MQEIELRENKIADLRQVGKTEGHARRSASPQILKRASKTSTHGGDRRYQKLIGDSINVFKIQMGSSCQRPLTEELPLHHPTPATAQHCQGALCSTACNSSNLQSACRTRKVLKKVDPHQGTDDQKRFGWEISEGF
jgi:hypothetical protein